MTSTTICGFHVGRLSKAMQFITYTSGIFFCYLINGYVSETIFRVPGFQTYGWFLTLFQYFFYIVCSYSEVQREDQSLRVRVSIRSYALLALLTVLTMGMSNASVGYMNYPTQLVFKSCKIPFVMFGAILLQGKRYDLYDFSAVFAMTAGLINLLFLGVIMVCCALIADAFVGNMQEKLMKSHSLSQASLIYHTYTLGFIVILTLTISTGELLDALKFSKNHFSDVIPLLVLFSATGYLGINFVLALIITFGAVWAVTVTTLRKAITICLSFIIFQKNFSYHYVWSGFLVIIGIYMNSHKKQCLAVCKVLNRRCNFRKVFRCTISFLQCRQKFEIFKKQPQTQVERLV